MTMKHDSVAYVDRIVYVEAGRKRTNRSGDGGVVIGTMPTKYLRFLEVH